MRLEPLTAQNLDDAEQSRQLAAVVDGLWATVLEYSDDWEDILMPALRVDATGEPAYNDNGPLSVDEARHAWELGLRGDPAPA